MGRPPPSVEALVGVLAGVFAAATGGPGVLALAGAVAAALLLPGAAALRVLAWAAALGAGGAVRWAGRTGTDDLAAGLRGDPVRVVLEGTVAQADPPAPEGFDLTLDVAAWEDGAGRRPGRGRVRVRVEGEAAGMPSLHAGDDLRVVGRLAAIPRATNPGAFDPARHAERQGIHARLTVPDPGGVERRRASDGLLAGISRARHATAAALDARFSPPDAGLLRSLLLGDRGALDDADRERFRAAGAAHVLAVSGAHVALLVAGLLAALRHLRVPARPSAGLVLAGVLAFVPFTGGAPPVVRSAAGSALFLLGRLLGREPSGGALLAAVAAGFLALDPSCAEDPGFRMSFAAASGLVLLAPRLRRALVPPPPLRLPGARPPRAPVRSALAAGLAAWLASSPIAVADLGQAGTIAVPVGLVVVPLSTLALLLGGAAAGAAHVPGLGPTLAGIAEAALAVLRAFLDVPAWLGWVQGPVLAPDPLWYALYAGAFLAAARGPRPVALAGGWVLAALWGALADPTPAAPPPHVRLTLLDVGHGQAVLLEAPDGQRALLDAGSRDRPDPAGRIVGPALRALRVTRLDLVTASHADADHAGALPGVLAHVPCGLVVVPPRFDPEVLARLVAHGARAVVARAGRVLLEGPWGRLVVVAPARPPPANRSRNDGCLVLAVETAGARVCLPGDREEVGVEDLLADAPDLAADVLVLPHHGHPGAGRERLASVLAPRLLLASGGRTAAPRWPPGTLGTGVEGALVLDLAPTGIGLTTPWKDGRGEGERYLPASPAGTFMDDLQSLALAAAVLTVISLVSVRLRWLTRAGALGAALLGLAAVAALGWAGLATLLAPFLAGTLAGRLPGGASEEGPRRLRQVAANGLPALVGLALVGTGAPGPGARAFAGALAALGADTLATEIGTRWGGRPRHALWGRPLARGESGGVTAAGLAASLLGGLLAPAALAATGGLPWASVVGVAGAGALAAYADSALGALLQRKGRCATCGRVSEGTLCCGAPPTRLPGRLRWLDNDGVNLVGGLAGAGLASWLG